MSRTADRSISKKLTWMNMLVSGAALLIACTAFIGYDLATFRRTAAHNLSAQAQVVGLNSVSAILFNDPQSAEQTLSALKDSPDISQAAIYGPDGHPFVSFSRPGADAIPPLSPIPAGRKEVYWVSGKEMTLVHPIVFQGAVSGTVYIRATIKELDRRLLSYAGIAFVVLLLSLLAALLVSSIFQKTIAQPIIHLAEIARGVSRDKNYSIRIDPIRDHGELSAMIDAFNEMLAQIQHREDALREARDKLEQRVETRTAELVTAKKLVEEVSAVAQGLNRELSGKNAELEELNSQLEQRIAERTSNLEQANHLLQDEMREREKSEKELRQVQRLDAVGRLAGGMAHDFNNLLGVILGQSEILRLQLKDPIGVQRLDTIREAIERGAALTRQLLAFGKQQVLESRVLNFNSVLTGVEKLLRLAVGESIELVFEVEPKLSNIKADPNQLEQIVLNLGINARDAMPGGGKLTIATANLELSELYADRNAAVEPGTYVQVVISDTGCGMDRETLSRIFEPFFTTKEQGKGTGLGLATVYGIVKQSGGYIWVYSEPGHGTTFKIYLPVVDAPAEEARTVQQRSEMPRGSEAILMVEDDTSLREVTYDFLHYSGYRVIPARSPEEALLLAESHEGPIHLLLTDMIMPKMNGRELAAKLHKVRPGTKVLYVSGYTDGILQNGGPDIAEEGLAFLQKPYTFHALTRKVREVIDSK